MGNSSKSDGSFIRDFGRRFTELSATLFGTTGQRGQSTDVRTHVPVDPAQMGPVERAYYEANKYMAHEVSKIPFVGEPLVKLGEAVNCSATTESLSPFQNSSPTCQGVRDGKPR